MIQMDSAITKYCVSWFSIRVANVCTLVAVNSWNQHTLYGKYSEFCWFTFVACTHSMTC